MEGEGEEKRRDYIEQDDYAALNVTCHIRPLIS